jgi:hypothetical protein
VPCINQVSETLPVHNFLLSFTSSPSLASNADRSITARVRVMLVETHNRRRRRPSWADLPEDMLGDVLRRLPSFADRARLRAVCRAWRAAWRRQPHPSTSWLAVPGHCLSLPDGAIHRIAPIPEDARAAPCRGSFGDWLAFVPLASSGGGAPFLLNPFSAARIPLPPWTDQHEPIRKIVMSSAAPDSSCVVAAMVDSGENRRRIAACRPGEGREGTWWPVSLAFDLQDIAFYEGRLHALPTHDGLVVFDAMANWTSSAASRGGCTSRTPGRPPPGLITITGLSRRGSTWWSATGAYSRSSGTSGRRST